MSRDAHQLPGGDAPRPALEVRVAMPSTESADRLWRCYQQAYRGDEDLLTRACNPDDGIDGLTEPLTAADIAEAMNMPDTVTLEACHPGSADSGGFIIVRYAGRAPDSIASFADYFLNHVFRREALRFSSETARREFERVLSAGDVLYFAEFVSAGGRATSAALLLATYREVCLERLASQSCTFVGKCLDAVRVGACTNTLGNRPIKALAEFLGLEKIGVCDQTRTLHVPRQAEPLARAFSTPPDTVEAVLGFALYMGSASRAAERVEQRGA